MSQQDNIFNGRKIKRNGKLIYINEGQRSMYEAFIDGLEEGQEVSAFLEANKDDGTNNQLAKIHVYIRKLANECGYTFEEMKHEFKRQSGLIYGDHIKSFSTCSKEELGLVLEHIKEACYTVGIQYD